jgi:hypothetical protein
MTPKDEAQLGWLRYEKLRRLSPQQYAELHKRNLQGESFDSLVDALPEPSTLRPWWPTIKESLIVQWQPIETAPKDGIEILLGRADGSLTFGSWYKSRWVDDNLFHITWPTHWMPLPTPPEAT